jgi:hypothetical protein
LERLDAPALKQLMLGLADELGRTPDRETYPLREVLGLAAKQLFKLEGEKAMAWVMENLQQSAAFDDVTGGLMRAAAAESPELGKRWADEDAARRGSNPLYQSAFVEDLASRGAEEAVELGRLLGELPRGLGSNGFPEGFDFNRLLIGIAENEANRGRGAVIQTPFADALYPAIRYWTAKDREAAWKGICEAMGVNRDAAGYVSFYLGEIRQTEGDRRALEILAEHFDEIPEAARGAALTAAGQSMDSNGSSLPLDDLITLLPEDGDRVILARKYLNPFSKDLTEAVAVLQKLGSEQLQIEAMEAEARKAGEWVEEEKDASMVRTYFNGLMERARISEGGRRPIEAALPVAKVRE